MELDENDIDAWATALFGMSRTEAVQQGICVACRETTVPSDQDWQLTGMCSKCHEYADTLPDTALN